MTDSAHIRTNRYRSKPTEIEAVQWLGDNPEQMVDFAGIKVGFDGPENTLLVLRAGVNGCQGWVPVPVGHWIVRSPGDLTDMWPVEPLYFADKYEHFTSIKQGEPDGTE